MKRDIFILAYLILLLAGCTNSPRAEVRMEAESYEDCFNGRLIVCSGGKFGIADVADSLILVHQDYEQLSFISDELALGRSDGKWDLIDKDGNLIASSIDSSFLAGESVKLYECLLEEESIAWDSILDIYEEIEKNPDRSHLNDIKEQISKIRLGMSDAQKERFSRILNNHTSR